MEKSYVLGKVCSLLTPEAPVELMNIEISFSAEVIEVT